MSNEIKAVFKNGSTVNKTSKRVKFKSNVCVLSYSAY